MKSIHYIVRLLLLVPLFSLAEKADLIIFSYDRPLQLHALLESIEKYVSDVGSVSVIYRASASDFAAGYQAVRDDFNDVIFIPQSDNPREDFKPLTMHCLHDTPHDYVFFAVDDIVVKDVINVEECIQVLEETDSYGFYLRMGLNLSYCYPMKVQQPLPNRGEILKEKYFRWVFSSGQYDWNYPHSVDMTIFRKKDVIQQLESLPFTSPNILEGNWAARAVHAVQRCGVCYVRAPMVNLPLNRVQNDFQNVHTNYMNAKELLMLFNAGLRLDIAPLHDIVNISAHMDYEPTFVVYEAHKEQ